jgi:hypothetical protein
VHEDGVGAGEAVGLGALHGLLEAPARDEGLDAGDDDEILVPLGVLAGLDLAGKLVDAREGLGRAADEAVGLGEELVFDADARDAALLQLADDAAEGVEVAVAGVAVEEHRHRGGVGHKLPDLEHLGPAGLVVIAYAEGGGDGQAAAPDALESGLLGHLGAEAVVGLHQEGQLGPLDHLLEARGLTNGGGLLHGDVLRRGRTGRAALHVRTTHRGEAARTDGGFIHDFPGLRLCRGVYAGA